MKALIQHRDAHGYKMVLQALVPFMSLRHSVLFTNKANPNSREDDKQALSESNVKYYQRRIDLKRIKNIEDFIIDSILDEKSNIILATLFPSSMILAIGDEDNEIKVSQDLKDCELYLNTNVFVVDGQHRMLAMMNVYDRMIDGNTTLSCEDRKFVLDYIGNYSFNCSILVNYDLWEQGQIFINVNFKQKPVNKSLYYEIFGSEYRENKMDWKRNSIYLAHVITQKLNSQPESPYYGKIKMLGTGKGYISQAFVVESILPNFRKNGIWYISDDYKPSDLELNIYTSEVLSFFYAVKQLFSDYWPKEITSKPTIICKTTSFGAFCRLLRYIHQLDKYNWNNHLLDDRPISFICKDYVDFIIGYLHPLVTKGDKLFGEDSAFAKNSGKGTEVKLFNTILRLISTKETSRELPEGMELSDISVQIQDYMWTNPVDDLDTLAHHYEIEDIDDFELIEIKQDSEEVQLSLKFIIHVTLYLDKEDDRGFTMDFPAVFKSSFSIHQNEYFLKTDSVIIEVDTDKYYQ